MTIVYPATTAIFAALLAIEFILLSGWVIMGRLDKNALFGDANDSEFAKRIRTQANFAEYVPFAVLLIALLEARGGSHGLVITLLVILLIARLIHPIGMFAPANSPRQFGCRGGGIIATFVVTLIAAIALLV